MSDAERVERLLRMALAPVEPPERLTDRLERGLSELTEAAAEELADWEQARGLRALERSVRDVAGDFQKRVRR
jgi:hypothetical protein